MMGLASITREGGKRYSYTILVGKPKGGINLRDSGEDGRAVMKLIAKKLSVKRK
jgi:hypothetical protein